MQNVWKPKDETVYFSISLVNVMSAGSTWIVFCVPSCSQVVLGRVKFCCNLKETNNTCFLEYLENKAVMILECSAAGMVSDIRLCCGKDLNDLKKKKQKKILGANWTCHRHTLTRNLFPGPYGRFTLVSQSETLRAWLNGRHHVTQ